MNAVGFGAKAEEGEAQRDATPTARQTATNGISVAAIRFTWTEVIAES